MFFKSSSSWNILKYYMLFLLQWKLYSTYCHKMEQPIFFYTFQHLLRVWRYVYQKVNKPGRSVRPIVSGINSPTFISFALANTRIWTYIWSTIVQNFIEFVNKVNNIELTQSETLLTFDLYSFFSDHSDTRNFEIFGAIIEMQQVRPN